MRVQPYNSIQVGYLQRDADARRQEVPSKLNQSGTVEYAVRVSAEEASPKQAASRPRESGDASYLQLRGTKASILLNGAAWMQGFQGLLESSSSSPYE